MRFLVLVLVVVALAISCTERVRAQTLDELKVEHHYVDSDGVKIHCVSQGSGPLLVLLHGFPDYWYTWRKQIPALAKHFQVVAIDLRGFNQSDQPEGVESYALRKLVGDVKSVVEHFHADQTEQHAVIVGHDWGGMIASTA